MSTDPSREWPVDHPDALPHVAALLGSAALGMATYGWTSGVIAGLGGATVRLSKTQLTFRRRIGFAWLWLPGTWLTRPQAEVVLSLGLPERIESRRWKEVTQPAPKRWMHHLEVSRVGSFA